MAKKLNKSSMLWFIRSRPYTTVAELRRRFTLDPDAVQSLKTPQGKVWVGLPDRPAALLEQLVHEGRVGLELSTRVRAPVVEGVFPVDLREFRERVTSERTGRNGRTSGDAEEPEDGGDGEDDS